MVQMKRLIHTFQRNLQKLWIIFLLLYSSLILIQQIIGNPIQFLYISFLIFIPGYAFTEAVLPQISKLEKIAVSFALSLALLIGLRSLMQTFKIVALFSETTLATILAIVCLIAVLAKHFRK